MKTNFFRYSYFFLNAGNIVSLYLLLFVVSCGPRFKLSTMSIIQEHRCAISKNACEDLQVSFDKSTSQSDFRKYQDLFVHVTNIKADHIKFYFADLAPVQEPGQENLVIAFCDRSKDTVFIDKQLWENRINDSRRSLLMMHELGHCAGHLSHDSREVALETKICLDHGASNERSCFLSRPASIMHPLLFSDRLYDSYKDEYHRELGAKFGIHENFASHVAQSQASLVALPSVGDK